MRRCAPSILPRVTTPKRTALPKDGECCLFITGKSDIARVIAALPTAVKIPERSDGIFDIFFTTAPDTSAPTAALSIPHGNIRKSGSGNVESKADIAKLTVDVQSTYVHKPSIMDFTVPIPSFCLFGIVLFTFFLIFFDVLLFFTGNTPHLLLYLIICRTWMENYNKTMWN